MMVIFLLQYTMVMAATLLPQLRLTNRFLLPLLHPPIYSCAMESISLFMQTPLEEFLPTIFTGTTRLILLLFILGRLHQPPILFLQKMRMVAGAIPLKLWF